MDRLKNLSTPQKIGIGSAVALAVAALCCCGLFFNRGHSDSVYPGTPTTRRAGTHRSTPTKTTPAKPAPAKKVLK